jgi:hypothetical protein
VRIRMTWTGAEAVVVALVSTWALTETALSVCYEAERLALLDGILLRRAHRLAREPGTSVSPFLISSAWLRRPSYRVAPVSSGGSQDEAPAARAKGRDVPRIVLYVLVVQRVACWASNGGALARDLRLEAPCSVARERIAHLGTCGDERVWPVDQQVELPLLMGLPDQERRATARPMLEPVPQKRNTPRLEKMVCQRSNSGHSKSRAPI